MNIKFTNLFFLSKYYINQEILLSESTHGIYEIYVKTN